MQTSTLKSAHSKEVHYINQKPISFTVTTTTQNTLSCDIRILVLSSQHEDMLFKVLFRITDQSGKEVARLYSAPLRVISKADGKKKSSFVIVTLSVY